MSSRKFKFISPGIFINEIDQSQLPALPAPVGPALIGRFEKGPALKPIQVDSFEEFVQTFGKPMPGGQGGDVFRDGNFTAPTYAAYAAQAWFRNNSPVTIVRLVGTTNKDALPSAVATAYAGWKTTKIDLAQEAEDNGGAFGLFVGQHPTLQATVDPDVNSLDNLFPSAAFFTTGTFAWGTYPAFPAGADFVLTGSDHVGGALSSSATGFVTSSLNGFNAGINFANAINLNPTAQANNISAVAVTDDDDNSVVTITYGNVDVFTSLSHSGAGTAPKSNWALTGANDVIVASPGVYGALTGSGALTGTLAAVWYVNEGRVELSGNTLGSVKEGGDIYRLAGGSNVFLRPVEDGTFKVFIGGAALNSKVIETSFNFTETSARYIRKRFNTNPTLTNSTITENTLNYWLGETFEGNLRDKVYGTTTSRERLFGTIIPLALPDETVSGGDFKFSPTKIDNGSGVVAKTGWFISQDTSTNFDIYSAENMEKLFRIIGRLTREGVQQNVKISIKDLRVSADPLNDYGTFTVAVRDIKDTDAAPTYLEQFNNCNLNPASDNYIAKKIGDKFEEWDYDSKLYREYGDYPNNSSYIRVEVADKVAEAQTDPILLPFGVFGPPVFKGFAIASGSTDTNKLMDLNQTELLTTTGTFVPKNCDYVGAFQDSEDYLVYPGSGFSSGSGVGFTFPTLRLRKSSSEGFVMDPTDAFFGVDTTYNSNDFDYSVRDVLRAKPDGINSHVASDSDSTEYSWVFSLDNIRNTNVSASGYTGAYSANAACESTNRANGLSYTVLSGASGGDSTPTYETVLDSGFDRFTTCLFGGFNGLDIKEREPFRNTLLGLDSASDTTNYAYNSIEMAMDTLRDPERVEYNLVAMPGITNDSLNSRLVRMAENRGDALAIIDLEGGYVPNTEGTQSIQDRLGTVRATVNNVRTDLRLNSSYGAAYYPWVQIRDTLNGATLWAPPSVAAIGALSYSEAVSNVWFAPAGFTRGGLSTNNAAGIPIVGVRQRLTSKDRDSLYENNINPIASFPAEGIVIFGQKTLQTTPSALDRINVRRLLIFLKREISRIAATLLFDQNVQTTWNRFRGQAESILSGVKSGLGLTDYKVVLDETTTTPSLIDRNILYAKIFIKPARAIEFIAIDFIITNTGASFED